MTQPTLFGDTPAPAKARKPDPRGMARKPAVPHGKPDRKGLYWYEQFDALLSDLPASERDAIQEMLLSWPTDRLSKARTILNRWFLANGLERDNWTEAMGQ